jgi:hypothetical protein
LREKDLPRHFEGEEEADGDEDEEAAANRETEDDIDPQLDRALELLKSWNVFKTVVARRDS